MQEKIKVCQKLTKVNEKNKGLSKVDKTVKYRKDMTLAFFAKVKENTSLYSL